MLYWNGQNDEMTKLLISTTVPSSSNWPPFATVLIVSSISVLLLSHSVQLTSSSFLVCSLFYPVGVIRFNIATTSVRRLKFVS